MTKSKTTNMILCALFTALIAVGAFIRIPVPYLPFSMQTFFVLMAGLLLGRKLGALSVFLYLLLGLIGLPIFTEGGGFGYIFKPSFGFIIGFVASAWVTGAIAFRKPSPSLPRLLGACLAGSGVVYLCGLPYYYLMSHVYVGSNIGVWPLFLYCFILTAPGDIVKSVAAALIAKRLQPVLRRN